MEIIRFEELEDMSYWCYYDNDVFGFMSLNDEEENPEEYEMKLELLNSSFFTGFGKKQFLKSIQELQIKDFTEIVETIIRYAKTPNSTIIKVSRLMHELFGSIVEIDETVINTSKHGAGYNHFMSDGIIVFVINRNGVMSRVAFTEDYLPFFFNTTETIDTDVFNNISNEILYFKLVEHYVIGLPICREELRKCIRNYSRKRKIKSLIK